MKIKSVEPIKGFWVDVSDDDEEFQYIRYSKDNWIIRMGESYESALAYEQEDLEKLFQEYVTQHANWVFDN